MGFFFCLFFYLFDVGLLFLSLCCHICKNFCNFGDLWFSCLSEGRLRFSFNLCLWKLRLEENLQPQPLSITSGKLATIKIFANILLASFFLQFCSQPSAGDLLRDNCSLHGIFLSPVQSWWLQTQLHWLQKLKESNQKLYWFLVCAV